MLTALKNYATPPSALARRLSVQSLLFASGDGTFLAGSAVFFTLVVGLSLAEVGIGLTIAAVASFIVAVPMGKLVDHFGPKRMWSLSAAVQGALFLAWPFIDSFPEYVALAVAMEVAGTLGGTAHGAYVIDILPPAERVESRAYLYSALNVGFSIGAFLGAGAIAFGNDVLRWAPVVSAVLFLLNALAIPRLPDATHDVRSSEPRVKPEGIPAIRRMIAEGRSINVTLIFSLERYAEALAEPWRVAMRYRRLAEGTRVYDYACAENNRNPVTESGQTITLGPDGQPLDFLRVRAGAVLQGVEPVEELVGRLGAILAATIPLWVVLLSGLIGTPGSVASQVRLAAGFGGIAIVVLTAIAGSLLLRVCRKFDWDLTPRLWCGKRADPFCKVRLVVTCWLNLGNTL